MEIDRKRNCYNCRGFRHIARYYRNQRFVTQEKRIEYKDNCNIDNLKEAEDLAVLD